MPTSTTRSASLEVLVAAGHHVGAEGAACGRRPRRHAQPRVGVDVGGADEALHQLVGDVVVLGQQLAGDVEARPRPARARRSCAETCRRRGRAPRPSSRCRRRSRGAAAGPRAPSVSPSAAPFEHSRPRLAGCSGSPRDASPSAGDGRRRRSRRRNRGRWCGSAALAHAAAQRGAASSHDGSAAGCARRRAAPRRSACSPRRAPSASPRVQLDDPVVQRAGDARAVHDALRQRPALVRAAVDQREDLVVAGAEHRDRRRRRGRTTQRAPRRGMSSTRPIVDPASMRAVHRAHCRPRRAARYSCAAAPAARSAQGSSCDEALREEEALVQRARGPRRRRRSGCLT